MKIDYDQLPPECDALCEFRDCLQKGEDKGTYTIGRGYTSYRKEPRYVCVTRMNRGCGANRNLSNVDIKQLINKYKEKLDLFKSPKQIVNQLLSLIFLIYNQAQQDINQLEEYHKEGRQ